MSPLSIQDQSIIIEAINNWARTVDDIMDFLLLKINSFTDLMSHPNLSDAKQIIFEDICNKI